MRFELAHCLRQKEERDDVRSVTWNELGEWYLAQHEHEISGDAEREQKAALVDQVIKRLVDKDNTLMVVEETAHYERKDRRLSLNPNIDPST